VSGDLSDYTFKSTSGGVNNFVFYVMKKEGQAITLTGVLRVYNNGNDDSKVRFELSVLELLKEHKFSFSIPETILSTTGKCFHILSNGNCMCYFKTIRGGLPKLTRVHEIGLCVGQLSKAMSKIDREDLPKVCLNYPYWEIYKAHRSVTRELFYEKL
jgi:Ser/Thr protein kinase RdoA (MazF antagonist)